MAKQRYKRAYLDDPAAALREWCDKVNTQDGTGAAYVGIDPGFSGGLVFMSRKAFPLVMDLPTLEISRSTSVKKKAKAGIRTIYNCRIIADLFKILKQSTLPVLVVLERGQPMPGDTGKTGFSIGASYGMWPLFLTLLELPMIEVMPAVWKRALGILGQDKDASRALAMRMFPGVSNYLCCPGDHNRAEAVLIAEYGRRYSEGLQATPTSERQEDDTIDTAHV